MPTVDQRIEFASANIKDKSGKKWTAKGRDWIRDEFWIPADGWKLWPKDEHAQICDQCAELAGEIGETRRELLDKIPQCSPVKCGGLKVEPIVMTILMLKRRSGKTFNTCAYALSQLVMQHHRRIAFICSSEDQMRSIFRENYSTAIQANPKLAKALDLFEHRGTIRCAKTKSYFEGMSTSHGSVTGRGRTNIIIDECRDVPARTAMALLPSINEAQGVECPRGHIHTSDVANAPDNCPVCRAELEPWYGRILLMSSAGIIEGQGGEKDWFPELVEHLRKNPSPNVHLYESEQNINPDVSEVITNTVENVFGSLESTRSYVAVEVGNQFTRKGENLLVKPQIDRCVSAKLRNKSGNDAPCVAFLDTSKTHDLTSLVVLSSDDERGAEEWDHVTVDRIDMWDPKKLPGGVINPAEVLAHLDLYLPLFPNLRAFAIDTRVMPWAIAMLKKIKRERTWGRVAQGWNKQKAERKSSWSLLHQRILSGTITIPPHDQLRKELLQVRKVVDLDGMIDVRDASRKRRHIDVGEALATCCYLAHLEALSTRTSLSATAKDAKARDILRQLYRPVRRSIELDKF